MAIVIATRKIEDKQAIVVGLTLIYGIGLSTARRILEELKIAPETKAGQLSEQQVEAIRLFIRDNCLVEGDKRNEVKKSIEDLKRCGSYRGRRHRAGLPMKKRTRTNAQTCKKRRRRAA